MIQILKNESTLNTELPFFAQEKYLSTKSDDYGWFDSKDFLLPFTIYKTFIFKRIVFTTEVIQKTPMSIENEKIFLDKVVEYIIKNKICDFIYKPHPSAVFRTYPENSNPFKWSSYILDIESDLDNMIQKMTSSSQRTDTRKALREGVKIEITEDAEEVYSMCNDTLLRQKIPLSIDKNEFMHQFEKFHPTNMLMFKAIYNNKIEGVIVMFKDKNNAFAEYSGSIARPKNGLMKLLNLVALKHISDNYNIQTYDFIGAIPDIKDGSKESGIQKFKKDFGANLKVGYQFNLVINPLKYKLFNFILKLKLKLKGIDYIDPIEKSRALSKTNLDVYS
jgi:hypothetical protein